MATKELNPVAAAAEEEKAKLREEKKKFKQEQKAQKKEAKRRAAEIAKQEEALGDEGGNGIVTFFATVLIVILWLAIVCVVIKMDVGGFGSSVLTPILKDVPVVNMILPSKSHSGSSNTTSENYGGYDSMEEAVAYIKQLELELEREQTASKAKDTQIDELKAETLRLKEFEERQVEFQRIQAEFMEEVVYAEKGPGAEEYRKFYEAANPTVAESIYRQVITQEAADSKVQEYAQTYSEMKPKQAAKVFEEMTDNLDLVAKILNAMSVDDRAAIMGVMDSAVAARLTKMMDPS
ncbi:MAG: hypothetical protein HFH92_06950 [Lachnospiraceae bacterium]|uniref:MotE family protein n=1 Tax=uncultured Acetatifactor sp. TaxID=1671927 RepID=UPI0026134AF3|nr:hypothetical protein [uncultured Acetatifactor sp.]MCI8788830.1 hypothetical protein [Lachnospiraceae bacterium]